jgi:hypothetical protein
VAMGAPPSGGKALKWKHWRILYTVVYLVLFIEHF